MDKWSYLTTAFILSIALAAAGCGRDYKAEVQSDTSWTGSFGGQSVKGKNDQIIDIPDDGYQCCIVQKNTESGYLKLRVYDDNETSPSETWEETEDTYGVVRWCAKLGD